MTSKPGRTLSDERFRQLHAAAQPKTATARDHYRYGTALLQRHLTYDAEIELRKAVGQEPTMVKAWVNLGGVLLTKRDYAGCVKANQRALEVEPEATLAHYNMGLGYLYQGLAKEMVGCFERVLELEPDNAGGHYHLALGLLGLGQIEQARAELAVATSQGWVPNPDFVKAIEQFDGGDVAIEEIAGLGPDS